MPPITSRRSLDGRVWLDGKAKPFRTVRRQSRFQPDSTMRFSRAQIIGAIFLLALIWLVIAIRLIISRG